MIVVRDDAGTGLQGGIDGSNQVYTTSHDMRLDRVIDVYVNGTCRMAELDNGYVFLGPRQIQLKEALLPGDTLSIRYICTAAEPGIEGSQPSPPQLCGAYLPPPEVRVARLLPPTVRNIDCPCAAM